MAKEKTSKSRPKGQASIKSFFGGGKKKESFPQNSDAEDTAATETDEHHGPDAQMEENASDSDVDEHSGPNKKAAKSTAPDSSDLPPINEIPAIFDDLVSHIPKIKDVAEHVRGRKLRVATMCSGTESPLLALELMQKSIYKQHGVNLDIEHVFSCEIEPFKQAYIERNFQPPLLFRDVCELGDGEAYASH